MTDDLIAQARKYYFSNDGDANEMIRLFADALEAKDKRIAELEADCDRYHDAALETIAEMSARIAQLEAALKPFADIYSDTIAHEEAKWKDNHNLWESGVSTLITAGHLRAVAAALKETENE